MPDLARPATQGGRFVCVGSNGRKIGEASYADKAGADRACATMNAKRKTKPKAPIVEAYVESQHPRGRGGKWVTKAVSVDGKIRHEVHHTGTGEVYHEKFPVKQDARIVRDFLNDERAQSVLARLKEKPGSKTSRREGHALLIECETRQARGPILEALLADAVAERRGAATGEAFTKALSYERVLRERLEEARHNHGVFFDPHEHPRDRVGRFVDVLARLKKGETADLPGGISVFRKAGHYKVVGKGGSNLGRTRSKARAAEVAMTAHEHSASTGGGKNSIFRVPYYPRGSENWTAKDWHRHFPHASGFTASG